jgi:hypothetical protein
MMRLKWGITTIEEITPASGGNAVVGRQSSSGATAPALLSMSELPLQPAKKWRELSGPTHRQLTSGSTQVSLIGSASLVADSTQMPPVSVERINPPVSS